MNANKLIALYCYICDHYNTDLKWYCQRFSNNTTQPKFTDVECLTIYLYCIIEEEKLKISSIHNYANKYLIEWFPDLPSYQTFDSRLNRFTSVFPALICLLLKDINKPGVLLDISLLDSMPIITCSHRRSGKVARDLTDKGYCSTKKLYYFGVKLHAIAFSCPKTLPMPEYFGISTASAHDLTPVRYLLPQLLDRKLFADKAYCDTDLQELLVKKANTCLLTPIKLIKGQSVWERQFIKAADDLWSTAVSKVRQPIESLFNWLIEKTDIQRASKVRSSNGLLVHVFGKIAAAIASWMF